MPYEKEPPPTGASVAELVRYYEGELEKLRECIEQLEDRVRALEP